MNYNTEKEIAKPTSSAVGLQLDNVMDQLTAVTCAVTAQERIDLLKAAQIGANELINRIKTEISNAESVKVAEEDEQLELVAKNLGYLDFNALVARRAYVKAQAPLIEVTKEKSASRNSYPKAPAVYQYKSTIDPSKGFTGSLRGAKGDWVKKHADGKPDMNYFREATANEIAEMQLLRDEYIKATDKMREDRAAKKQ